MITNMSTEKFKSFISTGQLQLRSVTLLAGQNSSGKSTLIQILLMLKQTLDSPMFNEPLVLNGALVSLGTYRDVLNYLVSPEEGFNLSIGITTNESPGRYLGSRRFGPNGRVGSIDLRLGFIGSKAPNGGYGSSPQLDNLDIDGTLDDTNFSVSFKRSPQLLDTLLEMYDFPESDMFVEGSSLFSTDRVRGLSTPKAVVFGSFFPQAIFTPYHKQRIDEQDRVIRELVLKLGTILGMNETNFERLEMLVASAANESRSWNRAISNLRMELGIRRPRVKNEHRGQQQFLELTDQFWVNDEVVNKCLTLIDQIMFDRPLLQDVQTRNRMGSVIGSLTQTEIELLLEFLTESLRSVKKTSELRQTLRLQSISRWSPPNSQWDFSDVQEMVSLSLRKTYYLGPLRDDPKAFYQRLGSHDPRYVGQRGENVAFVLKYYSEEFVPTVLPPSDDASEWNPYEAEVESIPLGESVRRWLRYIGIASEIRIDEMGKIGLTIRARIHGQGEADLTNVGVGVSQVLPLVVLGLASPPDATLLFEQPELHLHPYVQSRLGDFFVSLSRIGKQVIAETHSEHLVNRMRLHIARGNLDPEKDVAIYFCFMQHGNSCVQRVAVDEFGSIEKWPEGFFDETTKQLDSILTAALNRAEKRHNLLEEPQ